MTNEQEVSTQDEQDAAVETPDLTDDRLYAALASTQRRRLLYYLLDREGGSVDEIATVLTGWEATETGGMGTPDDRTRVRIALEHCHLPRLAEAGLVTYDREAGAVEIEPLDPAVDDLLSRSVDPEHSADP